MSSRADLAAFFNTGDAPTEAQFKDLIDSLRHIYEDADYTYKGAATSGTDPVEGTCNMMYIASTPGTYTNFNSLIVYDGEVVALKWTINPTTQIGAWTRELIVNRFLNQKPSIYGRIMIEATPSKLVIDDNGCAITAYSWEYRNPSGTWTQISGETTDTLVTPGTAAYLSSGSTTVRCKCTIGTESIYTNPISIFKL